MRQEIKIVADMVSGSVITLEKEEQVKCRVIIVK